MSVFQIIFIYGLIFLGSFLFALRYKDRLAKHDGNFPETLVKSFVIFVYIGGIFSISFLSPFLISQAGEIQTIAQSIDYSALIASIAGNLGI